LPAGASDDSVTLPPAQKVVGPPGVTVGVAKVATTSDDQRVVSVQLLEGDNDWPATMKALDDIAYHGYGIAEVSGGDAARLKFLAERMDKIFAD
jgi:sugar phosphate isomerase/epimerase